MARILSLKRSLSRLDELAERVIRVRGVWGSGPGVYIEAADVDANDRSHALHVVAAAGEQLMFYRPSTGGRTYEAVRQSICRGHECEVEGTLTVGTSNRFPAALTNVRHLFIDTPVEPQTCQKCGKSYSSAKRRTRTVYINGRGGRIPKKRHSLHCPHCDARVAIGA